MDETARLVGNLPNTKAGHTIAWELSFEPCQNLVDLKRRLSFHGCVIPISCSKGSSADLFASARPREWQLSNVLRWQETSRKRRPAAGSEFSATAPEIPSA